MNTTSVQAPYKNYGIAGTIAFHLLLLLLFLFWKFSGSQIIPPPDPQAGVVINFGTSSDGMGEIQPLEMTSAKAGNSNSKDNSKSNKTSDTKTSSARTSGESPAAASNSKADARTSDPRSEYKGGGAAKAGGEGTTGKPGDQGDPHGDPRSPFHTGVPGAGGTGGDYDLGNRKVKEKFPPDVQYINEMCVVVVDIWVDRNGKVVKSKAGFGTLCTNPEFIQKAEEAALKVTWEADPGAPEKQTGKIRYTFTPQ